MNEIEILRHIEWIIDKLKKSSTATYYLETDWETLPRIITLTEAINLRKELKKDFENRDPIHNSDCNTGFLCLSDE